MPNNTWFTPYKLCSLKCLSSGPSQGIVYELDERSVIKVPFQYPVDEGSTTDEKNDHLSLSLIAFNVSSKSAGSMNSFPHILIPMW